MVNCPQISGARIRNGSLRGWSGNGVFTLEEGLQCEDLSISECAAYGIRAGIGAVIRNCVVNECGTTANQGGILTGDNSLITGCS